MVHIHFKLSNLDAKEHRIGPVDLQIEIPVDHDPLRWKIQVGTVGTLSFTVRQPESKKLTDTIEGPTNPSQDPQSPETRKVDTVGPGGMVGPPLTLLVSPVGQHVDGGYDMYTFSFQLGKVTIPFTLGRIESSVFTRNISSFVAANA